MRKFLGFLTILVVALITTWAFTPSQPVQAQSAWSGNSVNYTVGTLVTYSGSTYKCITAHTSQPGWTPPATPSLWSLSSGGGGTTPTNTPVPSTGGFVVSEAQFNAWFPSRNALYTYANFISAKGSYSGFANSTNVTTNKIEAAAFFAHVAHESGRLVYTSEISPTSTYCGGNAAYGCVSGQSYHGRGPLQLSWNYNYKMASNGNYLQNGSTWVNIMTPSVGADIWSNPGLVSSNGLITWKTALWYWMNHGKDWDPSQPTVHADIVNIGFGETTRDINGGLECGQAAGSVGYNQMIARRDLYNSFLSNLGVSDSRTKTC
jgi:predicted chitinase